MNPQDRYRSYLPDIIDNEQNNDGLFTWSEKMLQTKIDLHAALTQTAPLMTLGDSAGIWIDVIGRWIGVKRPNVGQRPLIDGEILFQDINDPQGDAFTREHSFSTDSPSGPDDVTGTYFPSTATNFVQLMGDAEYQALLIAWQELKFNGVSMPRLMAVLDVLLEFDYTIATYVPGSQVHFQADGAEAFNRLVAADRILAGIQNNGIQYLLLRG